MSVPKNHLSKSSATDREIIGWREWVSLPSLGINHLEAKIDTGARTSSIDVHSIEVFTKRRQTWLRFRILEDHDLSLVGSLVEAKLIEYRDIRTSSGQISRRPVIQTELQLGTHRWSIELTLTNRHNMGYRMLIGRLALNDRFWVDAARCHIAGYQYRTIQESQARETGT